MRKFLYLSLVVSLGLAVWSESGFCQSLGVREAEKVGGASAMGVSESNLELKIRVDEFSSKLIGIFSNSSQMTLWFPIEPNPAYRASEKSHLLEIWLGYFEEVHGLHKGQYMLPAMKPVRPGGNLRLELPLTPTTKKALKAGAEVKIRARIATKDFVDSRIRNGQPFEDYLGNSIVIVAVSPR